MFAGSSYIIFSSKLILLVVIVAVIVKVVRVDYVC